MIDPLTEKEKGRINALHKRQDMDGSRIAADIVVGRHLRLFIHLHDEVEAYLKEEKQTGDRNKQYAMKQRSFGRYILKVVRKKIDKNI